MDESKKAMILAELSVVKAMLSSATAAVGALNVPMYPVTANMVNIPALPMTGNAIKVQSDCIDKLVRAIEKLIDTM